MLTTTASRRERETLRRVARRGRDFIIARYGMHCYFCKARLYLLGKNKVQDKYYFTKCIKGIVQQVKYFTIEHIIPLIEGGTNYIDNTVPCCAECNERRNEEYKAKQAAKEATTLKTPKVKEPKEPKPPQPKAVKSPLEEIVSIWNLGILDLTIPGRQYYTPITLSSSYFRIAVNELKEDDILESFMSRVLHASAIVKNHYHCKSLYKSYLTEVDSIPMGTPLKLRVETIRDLFLNYVMKAHYKIVLEESIEE